MRAERWFHTLVVVGASLSGCGGHTQTTGGSAGAAGEASADEPVQLPDDCVYDAHFACSSYEPPVGCSCDASAPRFASDCPQPLDFQCHELSVDGRVVYVNCFCGPRTLTPADCPVPEAFRCEITAPVLNDCHCEGLVVQKSDCSPGYGLCCQSYQPRFGCECCSLVIK